MAPLDTRSFDISAYLASLSLTEREELTHPQEHITRRDEDIRSPGPWAVRLTKEEASAMITAHPPKSVNLQPRDTVPGIVTGTPDHAGAVDPNNVNMKAIQAIFAIIGASMVCGAIWFFFWAKNGGFKFQKGDWDDYKSTVLRRKGPNGTTLSNATKSTRLGGGSVVGQGYSDRDFASSYGDDTSTVYTGTMTELSSSTAPIIKEKQGAYTGDKKSRKKKSSRQEVSAKERKRREVQQAAFEGGHDADVRAYMKEKPARVGGINAPTDTLHYGTDYTETESSVDQSHYAQSAAASQPPRHSQRASQSQSQSQPRASQSQSQSQPRASRDIPTSSRRDFSYTIGGQTHQEAAQFSVASSERSNSPPPMRVPAPTQQQQAPPHYHHAATHNTTTNPNTRAANTNIHIPGGYAASASTRSDYTQPLSELQQSNTKSYHHPLPTLRGGGGFRRGAGTDLDD